MRRDDVNELGLAILLVVVVVLVADCIWLHLKCSRQAAELQTVSTALNEVSQKLELHINPPAEPSIADKAKRTYEKVKSAAAKGFEAAKEEYKK